jgi:hypothetical protein
MSRKTKAKTVRVEFIHYELRALDRFLSRNVVYHKGVLHLPITDTCWYYAKSLLQKIKQARS